MHITEHLKEFGSCIREGVKGIKEMTKTAIKTAKPTAKRALSSAKCITKDCSTIIKAGINGAIDASKKLTKREIKP